MRMPRRRGRQVAIRSVVGVRPQQHGLQDVGRGREGHQGGLTSPANERARPMWTGLIMFSAALARLVDVLERRDREALRERDAGRVVRAVAVRDLLQVLLVVV